MSTLEDKNHSKDENRVSSESDSEFDEKGERYPQWTQKPACTQTTSEPVHLQPAGGQICMLKNGEIERSFCPVIEPFCMVADIIGMQLRSTRMLVTHVQDIQCCFGLFTFETIETNHSALLQFGNKCVCGQRWKEMDKIYLSWGPSPHMVFKSNRDWECVRCSKYCIFETHTFHICPSACLSVVMRYCTMSW